MKPRIEFVYDKLANLTRIYVWVGYSILHQEEQPDEIDDYERDGIIERLEKKYAKQRRFT